MTVKEIVARLQTMPPGADAYVDNISGSGRSIVSGVVLNLGCVEIEFDDEGLVYDRSGEC